MVRSSDMVTNTSVGARACVAEKLNKLRALGESTEHELAMHIQHAAACAAPARQEARLTCRAVIVDYCRSTSMHGVRYFVDSTRTAVERIFWMVAVTVSLCVCFLLIEKAWAKWISSPVIVSFTEAPTPMWDVPFPAVTVCPITKAPQRVVNFTELEHRMQDYSRGIAPRPSDEDMFKHKMMTLLCTPGVQLSNTTNHTCGEDAENFFRKVAPSLNDVIVECHWRGEKVENCSDLFRPVISDEGVCYTFNMLNERAIFQEEAAQWRSGEEGRWWSTGWNVETGYPTASDVMESYPWRSFGVGSMSGLRLVLRAFNKDLDYLCKGAEQGFKMPGVGLHHLLLPLNASLLVVAQPSLMTTSAGVRRFSPQTRQCTFATERALLFYKEYSQENCLYECLSNFTLKRCNCVPMFMPRSKGTPVCSMHLKCVSSAVREAIENETDVLARAAVKSDAATSCFCRPACTTLEYGSESSLTEFPWTALFAAKRDDHSRLGKEISLSQITVYFKQFQLITSRRSELYGQMDFLANCGGLLGLFNGFSVLSLVELLYFASFRLLCDVRRRRNRKRRERENQETPVESEGS